MSAGTSQATQQPPQQDSQSAAPIEVAQTRRVSKWVPIIASVCLGIVAWVLYDRGVLSKDWINWGCTLLNLVIGLLFAPEVLERTGFLGKAIQTLESYTQRLHANSQIWWSRIGEVNKLLLSRKGKAGNRDVDTKDAIRLVSIRKLPCRTKYGRRRVAPRLTSCRLSCTSVSVDCGV
jgi:hypothetical protein